MFKTNGPKFGNFCEPSYPSTAIGKGYTASEALPSKSKQASANESKFDSNDYVPKRFALKFDPPTIIVEYLIPSSGKLYHHKMKMTQIQPDSDTLDMLDSLKKKHHNYFVGNKISDLQMKNFIEKIKKKLQGVNNTRGPHVSEGYGENTNQTSLKFEKQNVNTPSKGDFLAASDLNKNKVVQNSKTPTPSKDKGTPGNNFWAFDDLEDFDDEQQVDYNTTNLNKLSKEELQKHKDKMDILFNKNQKKPGEEGFVYDKQEEFVPQEDNEWDDEF